MATSKPELKFVADTSFSGLMTCSVHYFCSITTYNDTLIEVKISPQAFNLVVNHVFLGQMDTLARRGKTMRQMYSPKKRKVRTELEHTRRDFHSREAKIFSCHLDHSKLHELNKGYNIA